MSEKKEPALDLSDDGHCFGCGKHNDRGLKLKFRAVGDELESEYTPGKEHQGYKDILHGGIMGLLLDEMMVNVLWLKKIRAVSVEFTVRLKRAVPIGTALKLKSRIVEDGKRRVLTAASAFSTEGELLAEGTAKCLKI